MKTKLFPRSGTALVGLLWLAMAPGVQAQFNYTTNNGAITITGYTGPGGAVAIPDIIDGLPVTTIGDYAFYYNTSLTSVTIPHSVTSIGDWAFESCYSLTGVTIPSSVTSIGDYAFYYNTSLTGVTIPNSVTSIGRWAFAGCSSLTRVTIPGSVYGTGFGTFAGCTGLINVTLRNGLSRIGSWVFNGCTGLTSLTIPNSVTSIGIGAFNGCTSLTGVYFKGNAPSIDPEAFQDDDHATVYYLPCTTGWGPTFGDRPTVMVSPAQSLQQLISVVEGAALLNRQPLAATLGAAQASLGRGNPIATANQLQAFQNKLKAQATSPDPVLASTLIQGAQAVIDALGCDELAPKVRSIQRHPDGKVQLNLTGLALQPPIVEASTNLIDWQVIGVALDQGNGSFEFEDADAAKFSSRFYRIK